MTPTREIIAALVILAVSCAGMAQPARVQDVVKMFPDGKSHDFGTVQRGAQLYHTFRIVNPSDVAMCVERIYVLGLGRRSISARMDSKEIPPGGEGKIEVLIDTWAFNSWMRAEINVRLDQGRRTEHRFWVDVATRESLAFFPDMFDFGEIRNGAPKTQQVTIAVPNQPKLRITAATCELPYVQLKVQELKRDTAAVYQVSATIPEGAPAGRSYAMVELTTNNSAMPKLHVPLNAIVERKRTK